MPLFFNNRNNAINNLPNNNMPNRYGFANLFFRPQNIQNNNQNVLNTNFQNNAQRFVNPNFQNSVQAMPQNNQSFMYPGIQNNNQEFINNGNQNMLNPSTENGISLKPLTEEELEKINDEIQENIEKNRKTVIPIAEPKAKDQVLEYVKEFIQNERNGNVFYNALSYNCDIPMYRDRLEEIGKECMAETNSLQKYYKDISNEEFSPENIDIGANIQLKKGLLFAIEEEIKIYNKLCNILEELPVEDTRRFHNMALRKLSRINSIQYMAMNTNL